MNALGNFIVCCGFAAFILGVVIILRPIQSLGFSRRLDGLLVIVAGFAIILLGQQLSPELRQKAAQRTAVAATANGSVPTKHISKSEALHNLRIGGFSWQKDGFGSVMTATFVIYNDNTFPVKDVTVSCNDAANSGTIIDSNTRTVYERIEPGGYYSVVDMNMGFIHTAAVSSACYVENFSQL